MRKLILPSIQLTKYVKPDEFIAQLNRSNTSRDYTGLFMNYAGEYALIISFTAGPYTYRNAIRASLTLDERATETVKRQTLIQMQAQLISTPKPKAKKTKAPNLAYYYTGPVYVSTSRTSTRRSSMSTQITYATFTV